MTEDKLYEMAMQCVKRSTEGCSCECNLCEFNISEYIPDAKKAALLKKAAYTDYISRQGEFEKNNDELEIRKNKLKNIFLLFIPFIVLFVVIGIIWCLRGCLKI